VPDETTTNTANSPNSEVLVERRDDGVVLITLNRPKMNALSLGLLGSLADCLTGISGDGPGAVVIWGGERIFAAGADVKEFSGTEVAARVSDSFKKVTDLLRDLSCVTIAAITGYALGGGLELAMGCDLRIASRSAKVGQPEILLGIIPGGGGTQRLARLVGASRAKDLCMTGRQITADEALSWGLVDRVVDNDRLLDEALGLAAGLASGPLMAIAAAKRAIDRGLDTTLEEGLMIERDEFSKLFDTTDAQHGMQSFVENGPGKATFVGH
jgi:enoyl-CoA hydratase/carnithine racemase